MQKVEQMSHGRVNLAAGTLYGATSTLVERGWIEPAEGDEPRRKAYHITELGLTAARQELDRLRELVANGEQVLERGR
jgi:DNA-binding PadR family transcriptional regulator